MNKTTRIVGAMLAFLAMFMVYIVWSNYTAQVDLREAAIKQFRDSSARKATTFGHFFSERRNDLDGLLASKEIFAYFENKALGMSKEYGLWASLVGISELFDRFTHLKSLGGYEIYARVAFVDAKGRVLADETDVYDACDGCETQALESTEDTMRFVPGRPDGGVDLVLQAPYRYRGRLVGFILAWLNTDTILPALMDDSGDSGERLEFFASERTIFSPLYPAPMELLHMAGEDGPTALDQNSRHKFTYPSGDKIVSLLAATRIGRTPFYWITLAPESGILGTQPPWQLLLYNVLLALVLLGGGAATFIVSERNLILKVKVDEAARQSEKVEKNNKQLQSEVEARICAEQELQHINDELELRVKERTRALKERSDALGREVQERRETEIAMRLLFNNSTNAIFIYELSGELIDVNETALELFEVEREKALQLKFRDLSSPGNDFGMLEDMWQRVVEGEDVIFDWEAMRTEEDGERFDAEVRLVQLELGGRTAILATVRDISEQKRIHAQQEEHQEFLNTIFEGIGAAIFVFDPSQGVLVDCNSVGESLLGMNREQIFAMPCGSEYVFEAEGKSKDLLCPDWHDHVTFEEGVLRIADRPPLPVSRQLFEVHIGGKGHLVQVVFDITGRKNLERKLNIAQKLESIGLLASGIAHEINTPIQYVGDSIRFVKDAFADTGELLDLYVKNLEGSLTAEAAAEIEEFREDMDVDFVLEETPKACERALEGVQRVATIVLAMKNFSHAGEEKPKAVDINKAIENTVIVTRNEWKYVADLEAVLDPDLPLVHCLPGGVNQVLLNIIVNAAHAIAENNTDQGKGNITIKTSSADGFVEVRVSDTGCGIPKENLNKIFDPFFTTKEVGKGTGQGLAIVHDIIVEKHGGVIDIESEEGQGTTFIVRLPVGQEEGLE